jgi:hypothetical protein
MFKMSSHDPFEYIKHKLWPKERLGVQPLKIKKCVSGMPHIVGKFLTRVTNLL